MLGLFGICHVSHRGLERSNFTQIASKPRFFAQKDLVPSLLCIQELIDTHSITAKCKIMIIFYVTWALLDFFPDVMQGRSIVLYLAAIVRTP